MSKPTSRRSVMTIGLFAAPIVLVKLLDLSMGVAGGPAVAGASPAVPMHEMMPAGGGHLLTMTPAMHAAAQRADELADAHARIHAPFAYDIAAAAMPAEDATPADETSPAEPDFRVQVIMGGERPRAMIGGELLHLGDALDEKWIIHAIDIDARRVIIRDPATGREVTLKVGLGDG